MDADNEFTLLEVKIIPPLSLSAQSLLVEREELYELLGKTRHFGLSLVVAHAGSGKTTLVASFADTLGAAGTELVAWYNLDHSDRDFYQFCLYLLASLRRAIGAGFGKSEQGYAFEALIKNTAPNLNKTSVAPALIRNLAVTLIGDLTLMNRSKTGSAPPAKGRPGLWLVLDDYQFADSPNCTLFLQELARLSPLGLLYLIISTRQLPAELPFATLLAGNRVQIIGLNRLIFKPPEIAALISNHFPVARAGWKEDEVQPLVDLLLEFSGGWAVILNLTLHYLSQRYPAYYVSPALTPAGLAELVRNWLGQIEGALSQPRPNTASSQMLVNQPVFNYLASELFKEQPPALQEFLMQSAVLPSLTEEWASYLSGLTLDQTRHYLAELETQQFFVNELTLTTPLPSLYQPRPGTAIERGEVRSNGTGWSGGSKGAGKVSRVYQYHNLLRVFFQIQLATRPALEKEVYQRAAHLCLEIGQFEAAVAFFLKGGPAGEKAVLEFLSKEALPLYETGRLGLLEQLFDQLPPQLLETITGRIPALLRVRGILSQEKGQLEEAEDFFSRAAHLYDVQGKMALAALSVAEASFVAVSTGAYGRARNLALEVIGQYARSGSASVGRAESRYLIDGAQVNETTTGSGQGADEGKSEGGGASEEGLVEFFRAFTQGLKARSDNHAFRLRITQNQTAIVAGADDNEQVYGVGLTHYQLLALGIAALSRAIADQRQGQLAEAEEWFSGAELIFERVGDHYRLNVSWLNHSLLHMAAGRLLRAQRLFEKTRPFWKRTGNIGREIYVEYFTASTSRRLGNYEEAVRQLEECWSKIRELGNGYLEPFVLYDLGESLRELGRYDEALQILQTGLDLARGKQKGLEIEFLIGLGLTHWLAGARPQAREFYKEAELLTQEYGLQDKGALIALGWSVSEVDTRAYLPALERLKKVLRVLRPFLTPPVLARFFFLMAIASFGYHKTKSGPGGGKETRQGGVSKEDEEGGELVTVGSSDFLGYLLVALEISDTFHYDPYLGCELTRAGDLLSYLEAYRPRLVVHQLEKNSVLLAQRLLLLPSSNGEGEGKGRGEENGGVTLEEKVAGLLNLLSEFASRHATLIAPFSFSQARLTKAASTTEMTLTDSVKVNDTGSRSNVGSVAVAANSTHPAYLLELRALDGGYGRVYKNGVEITNWGWPKARTLLFFLMEYPNSSQGKILTALWSLTGEVKPDTVYWLIAGLRKTLGPVATISKKTYKVELIGQATLEASRANSASWAQQNQTLIYYDAVHFEQGVKKLLENPNNQELEKTLSLYQGEYLGAVDEGWAAERRRELSDLYLEGRTLLANLYQQAQNYRAAIESWREVLRLDPYYEEAHLGIIESYEALGQNKEARQQQMAYDQAMRELEGR